MSHKQESIGETPLQNLRIIVDRWDEQFIYGRKEADHTPLQVSLEAGWNMNVQLCKGSILGLVDAAMNGEGTVQPRLYILEPDYLVDITTICHCAGEDAASPYFYLLDKFMPREESTAIQLGNAANQFLDDAVNGNNSFTESLQQNFKDYALRYCTLQGIDAQYFKQCQLHHDNIHRAVAHDFRQAGIDMDHDGLQPEPAFVCETLGLQGRMDLLTGDMHRIVELKSGKQDEYHGTFRPEHALQMMLYAEMLHYSLGQPREHIQTLLLYSRYPLLHHIRLSHNEVVRAMQLRNGIVSIDRRLRTDCHAFLRNVKEEDFHPGTSCPGILYTRYVLPRIRNFLHVIQTASPIAYDYFCTMVAFLQREQLLAKVDDPERGFAQAWRLDTATKRSNGNLIDGLRLSPLTDEGGRITHVVAVPQDSDVATMSNFREGDAVVLYERNAESDRMTNHQSLRCQIEELLPDRIKLRISHPGRSRAWLHDQSDYAIEPSHSDALFSLMYRGLFALLICPPHRRELILGLRQPEGGEELTVQDMPEPRRIAHRVASARDFHLLVGPPGSGKTNIALRTIIDELLHREPDAPLLLMAYTNRAVDEICQMLESMPAVPEYLRIGQELSCAKPFRHRLLRQAMAGCHSRNELQLRLRPMRIFCGTVASLCTTPELFAFTAFGTAILDEASQVLEPQLLPLLTMTQPDGRPAIRRFVFIGDHKQLPAVVVQPAEQSRVSSEALRRIGLTDCRRSLFERLHHLAPDHCDMLTRQGRMHLDIGQFVSQAYYEGRLQIAGLPHQTGPLPWSLSDIDDKRMHEMATQRMALRNILPLDGEEKEKANQREAEEVALLVRTLYQLTLNTGLKWQPALQVGIIVPFRAQAALVRRKLLDLALPDWESISIDTVERYQGSQRNVIIFSTVVHTPQQLSILSAPVESDGQFIDRKLNVAISRARQQFFLVGNRELLAQSPDYRELIDYIDTAR